MMAFSGVRISWLTLARKSDFAEEALSASRLALVRFFFRPLPLRDVAEHGAELVGAVGDAPDRHEQRDEPALADAADHLAAVVEHARDTGAGEPGEIIVGRAVAFRREQVDEAVAGQFAGFVAEQRLGAAVRGEDDAVAVDHDDAVGRGVEHRFELARGGFGRPKRQIRQLQPVVG